MVVMAFEFGAVPIAGVLPASALLLLGKGISVCGEVLGFGVRFWGLGLGFGVWGQALGLKV